MAVHERNVVPFSCVRKCADHRLEIYQTSALSLMSLTV